MKECSLCKKTKNSSEFMLYTETGNKSKVCFSCMEEIANGTKTERRRYNVKMDKRIYA